MPFTSESARAAGLKSAATRDPEKASAIARAAALTRWAGHEKVSAPRYPLLSGAELDYWIERIPAALRGTLSRSQVVRRATLLARKAAADAAVEAAKPPTDSPFALLRRELEQREGGNR